MSELAAKGPFLAALTRQLRAQTTIGRFDAKPDAELLKIYLKEYAPNLAETACTPAKGVLEALECYYSALAREVERRSKIVTYGLVSLNKEGFGRAMICAGRLVLLHRYVRSANSFSYVDFEELEADAQVQIKAALNLLAAYPEIVRLGLETAK